MAADNVLFCHATDSVTNPYVVGIQTDPDAIIKMGHGEHTGPVFDLTGGKDQPTWGDIIPAFSYVDSKGDTQSFTGLNVDTATGLDFLANECQLPEGSRFSELTLVKVVVNTGGGTALVTAWTLDATGGPTAFAEGTTGVHQEVAEGTYTLSELPAATTNYTASPWDCTNTEVNRTTVIIGPNDRAVTCTITNTYVPPTIVLTTVAAPTSTPGTCLAVGSVVATETSAYSWAITGTAIAPIYTAVAKTGYTLTGKTSWTLDLSKIGKIAPQSVDANGLCFVAAPAVVAGVVEDAPAAAPAVAPAVKSLAFTGAETVPLGLSGLFALVLGAVLTVASRRQGAKRPAAHRALE